MAKAPQPDPLPLNPHASYELPGRGVISKYQMPDYGMVEQKVRNLDWRRFLQLLDHAGGVYCRHPQIFDSFYAAPHHQMVRELTDALAVVERWEKHLLEVQQAVKLY